MEEALDFFSSDGRPLRASVSMNLTQQKITEFKFGQTAGPGAVAVTPDAILVEDSGIDICSVNRILKVRFNNKAAEINLMTVSNCECTG